MGWINFNPTGGGVTLNTTSGDFDGYAWAENAGWIHFQNASPTYKVTYDTTLVAPTNLTASTLSKSQIDLKWTDNSSNETGFKIEKNGSLITTTAANATSYSNTGLTCDADYSYSVIATNGSLDSDPATITKTLNCPIPSYKLTIERPTGGTITGDGISCGSDCQQYFNRGTEVPLTAIPYGNLVLVNWDGDCDENGTVFMNRDKICTAQFLQPTLNLSATTLNFTEGEVATSYSLWLNTQPSASVTLSLIVDDEDIQLSSTLLTFDPDTWNRPQTVEINHIDDDIMQGQHQHMISQTITSNDPNYDNLFIEDIDLIITDNDTPGIHLSSYEINVTEGQTDGSYSIHLTTQPFNEVTIELNTANNADLLEQDRTFLSPSTLLFTIDNWKVPQNVVVSVIDDHLGEGTHDHPPITHQVHSEDATYDGSIIEEVSVHVVDNDVPNLTISVYQLNVTEGSTTAQTHLALTTVPTQTVTVNLTAGTQISVIPQNLVFDSQNWNLPQTVNVSAIDDNVVEGNHTNLILVNTTSADINYQGLSLDNNPTVNITDNDSAGINLSTHQVTVIEEGDNDSYTMVLTTEPINDVVISLTVGVHTSVSPNQLGFNLNNWNIPQTVTVSALDDDSVEGEDTHVNTIAHQVSSDDPNYNGLAINPITVNIIDNIDEPPPEEEQLEEGTTISEEESPVSDTSIPEDETVNSDEVTNDSTTTNVDDETPSTTDDIPNETEETTSSSSIDEVSNISDSSDSLMTTVVVETPPKTCVVNKGIIEVTCNAGGEMFFEKIIIAKNISVSHGIFEGPVENHGWLSDSIIHLTLTGGKLTGTITNQGMITDIEFVGAKLSGGTLSGTIIHASEIGGVIENVKLIAGTILRGGKLSGTIQCASDSTLQNVQLAARTMVSGGILAGKITGDPDEPPLITAAEIAPGTILSDVRLSPSVELPDDIVLGLGVILPSDPPTFKDFGFDAADIAALDAESLAELEPDIFGTLGIEEIESISPGAISKMAPEQMANYPKKH
ncbi:Na-Ca exchanger/integrin-beta4 [Beggiatoa sp. PS]|nr:Na-Ca exchanger/integrin-beta4 [Beggiatoa sp. PS]